MLGTYVRVVCMQCEYLFYNQVYKLKVSLQSCEEVAQHLPRG